MGEWTPDTLKAYLDELRERDTHVSDQANAAHSAHRLELEQRFVGMEQRIAAVTALWQERASAMGRLSEERLAVLNKTIDDIRKLVYIGMGIVLALQFIVPLAMKIAMR